MQHQPSLRIGYYRNTLLRRALITGMNLQNHHSIELCKNSSICPRFWRFLISRGRMAWILFGRLINKQPFKPTLRRNLVRFALVRPDFFFNFTLTPSERHFLELSCHLNRLCNQLIQQITTLFLQDALDAPTLTSSVNDILEEFFQRKDIAKIDTFAILNSLRKAKLSFGADSKQWTVCFSKETAIRCGAKKMSLTVTTSGILEIFRKLNDLIKNPFEKDLFILMYREIFRHPSFRLLAITGFELTVNRPYAYWYDFMEWETKREDFLIACVESFIRQPFFSSKVAKRSSFTPKSFTHFFDELGGMLIRCQTDDLSRLDFSKMNFDPMIE